MYCRALLSAPLPPSSSWKAQVRTTVKPVAAIWSRERVTRALPPLSPFLDFDCSSKAGGTHAPNQARHSSSRQQTVLPECPPSAGPGVGLDICAVAINVVMAARDSRTSRPKLWVSIARAAHQQIEAVAAIERIHLEPSLSHDHTTRSGSSSVHRSLRGPRPLAGPGCSACRPEEHLKGLATSCRGHPYPGNGTLRCCLMA